MPKRARDDQKQFMRTSKRTKKNIPVTDHTHIDYAHSPSYYYTCTKLYYITDHIAYVLEHCDTAALGQHLCSLFRAWSYPQSFEQVYRRGDAFITGFNACPNDEFISERTHLIIDTRGRRTNNGNNGSKKSFREWERWLTVYGAGRQTKQPFLKHPICESISVDLHDKYMEPYIQMVRGQGNRLAPPVRTTWVDPASGNSYNASNTRFRIQTDSTRVTADHVMEYRYCYSAGQYWSVSDTYGAGINPMKPMTEEQATLWSNGGPRFEDHWRMTQEGWTHLHNDCTDFLYALKIIADHEDKTCLLSEQTRTTLEYSENVARIRQRAHDLLQRVHEPIINMLCTLRKHV